MGDKTLYATSSKIHYAYWAIFIAFSILCALTILKFANADFTSREVKAEIKLENQLN